MDWRIVFFNENWKAERHLIGWCFFYLIIWWPITTFNSLMDWVSLAYSFSFCWSSCKAWTFLRNLSGKWIAYFCPWWMRLESSFLRIKGITEPHKTWWNLRPCHRAKRIQYKLSFSCSDWQMQMKQFGQGSESGFPLLSPLHRMKKWGSEILLSGRNDFSWKVNII